MRANRRDIPGLTAGATASAVTAARAGGKPGATAPRPNVLLILVDDLGDRCLSCFGSTVPTPNLDRLAQRGMVFRHAHAAPMCAPTRDEMFTGLSRAYRGRPGADVPFFTNHLKRLGYATGMAGKWFVGRVFDPPLRGFDESLILVNGYAKLESYAFYFHGSGGGNVPNHGGYRTVAGMFGARHSRLGQALLSKPHQQRLAEGTFTEEDFRRLCLWLDLNSMEFGSSSIDPRDQARQRAGEIVWPKIDFDVANPSRVERIPPRSDPHAK